MKSVFGILIMFVVLSGCYQPTRSVNRYAYLPSTPQIPSINKVMDSWLYSPISEVILKWGPYTRVVDDGAGGHVYIWQIHKQVEIPQQRWITPAYTPPRNKPQTIPGIALEIQRQKPRRVTEYVTRTTTQQRIFYTHSNGMIYYWKIQ